MKKNLLTLLCFITFAFTQAQNVPNGGFETWASGNPTSWLTNNIPTVATTITQATPSHSGTWAVKGIGVTTSSGDLAPFLASTDMSGNGFAVTQAYSTLSFYYKTSLTGSNGLAVLVSMTDASSNGVGAGVMVYTGNVSSFTLATVPIYYSGSNPVKCTIEFTIFDTTSTGNPTAGNYFIVDDVGLSGLASVNETTPALNIASVYPNPASHAALVQYYLLSKSEVQFQVLNTQGKMVRDIQLPEQAAGKHDMNLDVSSMPAGFYILRMKTKGGITFSRLQVAR
jgi:hypothetical protein